MGLAVAEGAPRDERDGRGRDRYRGQHEDVWPSEPSIGDGRICERGPNAHNGDGYKHGYKTHTAVPASRALDVAFGFQDQPSRAEKPIAEREGDAGEDREWRQERK